MNRYITELIGTFFLTLTVGIAAVLGAAGEFAPFAIGGVLVGLIYAGGHISGAHYNPAVTLGFFLRGRCPVPDIAPYVLCQLVGAGVAAGLVKGVFASAVLEAGKTIEAATFSSGGAVVAAELLFTFALVYVILNVATSKSHEGNGFYGVAIGFTVLMGVYTVGDISLAGFNPAVSTGLVIMGKLGAASSWMHFVPQLIGGVLAAFTFRFLNPEDM